MKKMRFRIQGVSPLIMHNGDLVDPLNPYTRKIKEVSSQRKKTDADHEKMARLEWFGSLYLKDGGPCIPAANLQAMIAGKGGSARIERRGKQAAISLFVENDAILEYDGSRSVEELYEDKDFVDRRKVVVRQNAVIRTRPIFNEWATEFTVVFVPDRLNEEDLIRWVKVAGDIVGLMEQRPGKGGMYGRFKVQSFEDVSEEE